MILQKVYLLLSDVGFSGKPAFAWQTLDERALRNDNDFVDKDFNVVKATEEEKAALNEVLGAFKESAAAPAPAPEQADTSKE